MRTLPVAMSAVLALACAAWAADSVVTVRVGEQDTCKITSVTTVTPGQDRASAVIRFDLGKLPKGARVSRAVLRMWVNLGARNARTFGAGRWDDAAFDGFNVWAVGGADKPVATCYPFAYAALACHEWDVTAAVKAWMADPAANKGLRTDFPLPAVGSEPAWQRPYLEITAAGPNPNRPPQPKDVKAFYRAGQVFITWKQIPHTGAFFDSTYRVYAHAKPITAANLSQARRLGEVHRLSQLNYRRTAYSHDGMGSYAGYGHFRAILGVKKTKDMTNAMYWEAMGKRIPDRYNFVIDDTWPDKIESGKWLAEPKVLGAGVRELKGPELADDTGLFVHTVAQAGKAFFAVTSAVEGNENRQDFAAANAPAGAVEVKVAQPKPVLQVAFHRMDAGYPHQKNQIREYAYWAGGSDGLSIEPSTPFYFRINPPRKFVGFGRGKNDWKAWVSVEPWWSHGGSPVVCDSVYMPPTRLTPFPPNRVPFTTRSWAQAAKFYYGSRQGPDKAYAGNSRWRIPNFYGYHDRLNTGADPRKATVRPFYENRALRELDFFFGVFPKADRNLIVATGENKSLLLAIHHPDVFAHCSAAQEEIWTSKRQANQWAMIGRREWKLVNDKGFDAWDYNDPVWYARKFPKLTWPFISICQSPNYARSDQTHWGDCGYPGFYLAMAADRRGGAWWWCDIGDAPNGGFVPVPRNQAYLAFTNCNFCETPQAEWRREPRGTLNGYLVWHNEYMPFKPPRPPRGKPPVKLALPLGLVDTAEKFEVAIRIGDRGRSLNGQSVPPTTARFGQTDVTPWRFRQFKVAEGKRYVWTNHKVATGQLLQSGTAVADARGLITVKGFYVDRDPTGNRLTIIPAAGKGPPAPDAKAKVGDLTLAQYARKCTDPVLFPAATAPRTTFKIAEFAYVRGGNADGSVTFKGGSFGTNFDTIVRIDKPGPYIITARAKGVHGAAWPLMSLGLGGKYGRTLETKFVDTDDWAPYRWFANLEAGKLRIRINAFGDYYARPVMPALAEKRLHVADLTFARLDPAAAEKKAVEIRISPRRVTLPAGIPARFTATVLNGLGKPMAAKVQWSCQPAGASGGPAPAIGDDGRFTPANAGAYLIKATAGGIEAVAPITVGEAFTDEFNHGGALLRGWSAVDLAEKPGKWHPPGRGHSFLNSLWQHNGGCKSMLLWDAGAFLTDAAIQADVFLAGRRGQAFAVGKGRKIVHGLVIRAADKDNHYRLEIERRDDGGEARLVKRASGKETVLAKADTLPALAAFDWQANPMCPGWHAMSKLHADERGISAWRMDRMKLQAAGGALRVWVNGKEVFKDPVKDADLKSGTVGLYAENRAVLDNVRVSPAR